MRFLSAEVREFSSLSMLFLAPVRHLPQVTGLDSVRAGGGGRESGGEAFLAT